jgi:putative spermidine/putrescine transport system substrate-binding protein
MSGRKVRVGRWAVLGLLVGTLSVVAAGCGGGNDNSSSASTEIEGLGTTLEQIQANAKNEGEVNLVIWPGYADKSWADTFTKQTGCKVNAKESASSDDMVDLMATGAWDGVSASGDATLRLVAKGDAAPVNFDLTPNYADVFAGLKDKSYNTVDGVGYGVPHGRGANLLVWNTGDLPADNDSWAPIWPGTDYKGKLSIYDNQIFIADAAIYLKATQPDLNITNPYELDEEQFNAAVDLLKQQRPNIGEYWDGVTYAKQVTSFKSGESVVGTTWQYMVNLMGAEKPPLPVKAIIPKEGTTGWSDTWMIYSKAAHPNCMYLWMNYIISPEANAKVAEYFVEAPSNAKACDLTTDPDFCTTFHADDDAYWEKIYYWTTPQEDCGDSRGDVCKSYEDWRAAWTEIKG